MTTNPLPNDTPPLICKHLPHLPPVVSDWQQSCQQPRCPHYCQGVCCNQGRERASAPCLFDGQDLLLEDAQPAHADDSREDNRWRANTRRAEKRIAFGTC
jgi:hypothetical protein